MLGLELLKKLYRGLSSAIGALGLASTLFFIVQRAVKSYQNNRSLKKSKAQAADDTTVQAATGLEAEKIILEDGKTIDKERIN